jgi:ketosteroid isomerase-like protein
MKHQFLAVISVLALTFTLCTTSGFAQKDISEEIQKECSDEFLRLFNAGDIDAFIALYTDDARLLPPNSPVITGKDNLKKFWGGMMSSGIKPVLKTVSAFKYGKTAIEEGIATIYAGDQVVDTMKYIVIWKKINGTWKMYQDIFNSDNPIPE